MFKFRVFSALIAASGLLACSPANEISAQAQDTSECRVELVVLGIGQDAGAPQIGNPGDLAWKDPSKRLWATSLALIDHESQKRYLFEATPDIREQIQYLDEHFPMEKEGLGIDGIFLTHAHIGHYAGLMFLGRESAGTKGVPVYVMPRMKEFLETNGPWSQLVELGNIELKKMHQDQGMEIGMRAVKSPGPILSTPFGISSFLVPHRDEFSETVGILIKGLDRSAFFVPDIDEWEGGIASGVESLSGILQEVNYAFLDATFFDDNELPGRDMSQIPHPRVTETMDLMDKADEDLRGKVRFIHINHTNPLRNKSSGAYQAMANRGYKLAYRGERFCL